MVTICTIAGGFGTGYTLRDNRVGMDPETLRFSKLIVLWGANVLSTNPHLWRSILEARKNGALIVAIDPIRTRTAAASDWHLAPIPGTDAALALALLHVVVREGKEDRQFIGEHTLGWEAFRQRILEFPPARAAAITGLPTESIVELGKRLGDTRPTGIRIGIGIQRHGGGGMAVRTITCIPGVTGDWSYPGGGVCYDTRGFYGLNWAALWRDDLRARPARALHMTRLGEGLLEIDNPPVKALFIYAGNPVASVPHQTKVLRGLARRSVHRRRRPFSDRHRALRGHLLAGHDGDRAPRSTDRLRASVRGMERARRASSGRMSACDRDVPAAGANDGPGYAGVVRQ